MPWVLGSTQITLLEKTDTNGQIIARLQPLASGTVHHIFGYEDQTSKLSALVVGETDKAALASYTTDASAHDLYYTNGFDTDDYGDFLVKNISFRREPVVKQSIRQDLNCREPVFNCEIELYRVA